MKVTVKQVMEANENLEGLSAPEISSTLKVLARSGAIDVAGKFRTGKKGRAANVYDIKSNTFRALHLTAPAEGVNAEDLIVDEVPAGGEAGGEGNED